MLAWVSIFYDASFLSRINWSDDQKKNEAKSQKRIGFDSLEKLADTVTVMHTYIQGRSLLGCEDNDSYFEFKMLKDIWFEKSGRQGYGTQAKDPGRSGSFQNIQRWEWVQR